MSLLFLVVLCGWNKNERCFRFDAKRHASIRRRKNQSNTAAAKQSKCKQPGRMGGRGHPTNSTAAHPSQRNSISEYYSRSYSSNSGDGGANDAHDDARESGAQDPHTTISSSSTCARAAALSGSSGVAAAAAVDEGVSSNRPHPTWSSA